MKIKIALLILAFSSVYCQAQTQLTITGTIQDSTGNLAISGYVEFDLIPQNSAMNYTVIGITAIAPQKSKCGINASGVLKNTGLTGPCKLWGNDAITPVNSLYAVIIAPANKITNTIQNVLFCTTNCGLDLSNLTITAPQPLIGTVVNGDPLVTMGIVPSIDQVWMIGQPNLRYTNIFAQTVTLKNGTAVSTNVANPSALGCVNWVAPGQLGDSGNPCGTGGGGGGVPTGVAKGSALVSNGVSQSPIYQAKAVYDTRDWATCDTVPGTSTGTDATSGIATMLAAIGTKQATVRLIGTGNATNSCLVSTVSWPANVTIDRSGGGSLTMINTITPPGGGAVDGSPASCFNTSTTSCVITLNVPTNGDAIALFSVYHFAVGGGVGLPTDSKGNVYRLVFASDADPNHYSTNYFAWVASNVPSGSVTITIPYNTALNNTGGAVAISGLGPSVGADGTGIGCFTSCNTNSPMTTVNPATYTAGSFLVSFGGQTSTTETCTAGGSFTQILNIGTNMSLCAQVIANTAGGAVTATQAISSTPTGSSWGYASFGLKPVLPTQAILSGIYNPNRGQMFYGALPGQGTVDFTGNQLSFEVYPEWWGASPSTSAATNTPAIQASIYAAFGQHRTNGSGLSKYNKPLHFAGPYQINDELKWYNNNNFIVNCDGRLKAGLTQTAVNKRIMDSQSMAYGSFHDCQWTGTASSTKPLLDIDYDGGVSAGVDFAPQFLDFYNNTFIGSGLVDVGLLGAKSGGGAQFSNIYLYDSAFQGFTGAAFQIGGNGTGRNVGRSYATNALAIGLYGGDMQNCPLFGFANYGGGYIEIDNYSFECTSPLASYLTQAATAVDVYCEATQGPCAVNNTRSEDLQLVHSSNVKVNNSSNNDQSTAFYSPVNCIAGSTEPLNWFIHPSDIGGDGALYQVTVHGTAFGGLCLTNASSGTATTIVDTNQRIAGAQTIGTFVIHETVTQAVTGATGVLLNIPTSTGTITGSVTSGTIGVGDTVTQATTGITCKVASPAPTLSANLLVTNCSGTADNSHVWTDGTTAGTYTPSTAPVFAPASPIMLITAATGAPDNTHNWTGATGVLVPSAAPVNDVNWTLNQFATAAPGQQQITIWGGAGLGTVCGPITANTAGAGTITFTTCASNYYGVHTATFDNTTQFIVEPCTAPALSSVCTQPVTQSGDFTWAKVSPVVIGGDNINIGSAACGITDSTAQGGRVLCNGSNGVGTRINNLTVSRPDWYTTNTGGFDLADAVLSLYLNQVTVRRPFSGSAGPGTSLNWSIGHRNGGATIFSGPIQMQIGTTPLVWSCGANGGGISCNDVTVGGRSDPNASTNIFRNRLEYTGMLGVAAPSGFNMKDQNGSDTNIGGGPSTGAGTGGKVCFWISAITGSSSTVNTGTSKWCIDGATGHFFATTDNTNDIGASGANRPRNIFIGGTLNAASVVLSGTPFFATGTASNTDVAGELAFSAATTSASYTFVGTYISHPECTIGPLFDFGAHRIWISTLSTTTLQLSSDSAQTGAVSYHCIGRN